MCVPPFPPLLHVDRFDSSPYPSFLLILGLTVKLANNIYKGVLTVVT